MADISISLANVQNIKTVNIEGLGVLRVRKLGAGEELDLSDKNRRLSKIIDELDAIDFKAIDNIGDDPTDEQKKTLEALAKKADRLNDEILDIKRFQFNIYKRCFSDDKNGELVNQLMNTLTEREITALFTQIFKPAAQVEVPEAVKPESEASDE